MADYYKNDISLVEGCVKRDLSAWSAFISKYSGLVATSVENILKRYGVRLPRQDIEDIRQEVLASIWKGRKLEAIRNREDISSWVAVVSQNTAIGYARKISREPQRSLPLSEKMVEEGFAGLIPSGAGRLDNEVFRNELSEKVNRAMEALPTKEKLMIELNIVYGKKYDEISEMLSLPKGTVSSYIKRAKERLGKALADFKQ